MNHLNHIIKQLREKGFRITKARQAILGIFHNKHCALSAQDLSIHLKKKKLKTDPSTIYRELQFLSEQKIIQEVVFKDGVIRYELREENHHHHLVCTSCDSIEAIELENHLLELERSIQKKRKFTITSHSLEFYGACNNCA